jgi:predicted phosphodiesterase
VLTAVISDLHLGTRHVNDVLRIPSMRARLMPLLAPADQLVLLGDVVELRQAPLRDALDAARPFFEELGETLRGRRVVLVPGNHDHYLLGERATQQFERALKASGTSPLGLIASWMPGVELVLSYPGYRVRDDVYATHGHYLDAHNTVPMVETMAVALARRRRRFPSTGPLSVDEYERVVAPLYQLSYRAAQRPGASPVVPGAPSKHLWQIIVREDGRSTMAGRFLGGVVLPGGVAALNRLGFGPFNPEVSGPALREAGLRAIAESLERRGIEADYAIFGHTHRAGPLPGDDGSWVTPRGVALHNCGNWVYERGFVGRSPVDSPYWPGGVLFVGDEGPPRLERPLTDLTKEDFAPMLEPSSRASWPESRDPGSPPPP